MSTLSRILVGLTLLSTLLVAAAPTASAVTCAFAPSPVGGIVGRTHEYATNVAEAVCGETISYYSYVCSTVLGPQPACAPR
jgi:hypothetical protein